MKVVFIAHRSNYFKHYGPIIDAALKRGWTPECWVQDVQSSAKKYLQIDTAMLRKLWPDIRVERFNEVNEVAGLLSKHPADAIISLHARNKYFPNGCSAKFLTLQHNIDTFVDRYVDLATSDVVALVSPFWWDYGVRYYAMAENASPAELEDTLLPKVSFVGFPQLDAFHKIQPVAVRERLGIPLDQPVVLVMPIDLAGWDGPWPRFFASSGLKQWQKLFEARSERGFISTYWPWALRQWNDEKLVKSIQTFCRKNNAIFFVKGREKDPLRQSWVEASDKAFYDDAYYPPTNLEMMAISSLCIAFYSTALQETAYAGVPGLCVDRPNRSSIKHKLWRTDALGGPNNFPGVITWKTLPEMMTEFANRGLGDFEMDTKAQWKYVETYTGPADYRSSERVLDLLKK